MANTLDQVAINAYHMTFQNTYEDQGKLRNCIQVVQNVTGESYTWPEMGEAVFNKSGADGAIITQSDTKYSKVVTTFQSYDRLEAVSNRKQAEVQQNILTNLARKYATGMGRREDQVIIDALEGATLPTDNVIANGSTNLSVDKIVEAGTILDDQNVPEGDRYLVLTAKEIKALMKLQTATDKQYVNFTPLMMGGLPEFFGFKIIKIGNRTEGGLEVSSNIRNCYAFHMSSVGMAYNINPFVKTDYSVDRNSHIAVGQMSLGANVLQGEGVVRIGVDTTA